MENWKDYVGFQPVADDYEIKDDVVPVFFLTIETQTSKKIAMAILREKIDQSLFVLTESEVGDKVEEILNEFPQIKIEHEIELARAKNQVAIDSRRGIANTNYNNTWFYKGLNAFDVPIIVSQLGDKYYVFKHPVFEKYGFNVL